MDKGIFLNPSARYYGMVLWYALIFQLRFRLSHYRQVSFIGPILGFQPPKPTLVNRLSSSPSPISPPNPPTKNVFLLKLIFI
jgi:hypothetical protein